MNLKTDHHIFLRLTSIILRPSLFWEVMQCRLVF